MIEIKTMRDQIGNNTALASIVSVQENVVDDLVTNFLVSYADGSRIHCSKVGHSSDSQGVLGVHGVLPGKELYVDGYKTSQKSIQDKQFWSVDIQPHGLVDAPHHNVERLYQLNGGRYVNKKTKASHYEHITQSHLHRMQHFLCDEMGIEKCILESTSKGGYDAMLYHALFPERVIATILAAPSGAEEQMTGSGDDSMSTVFGRMRNIPLDELRAAVDVMAEGMIGVSSDSLSAEKKDIIFAYLRDKIVHDSFSGAIGMMRSVSSVSRNDTKKRLPELSNYATDVYLTYACDDHVTSPDGLADIANAIGIPVGNMKIFEHGGHAIPVGNDTEGDYRQRRDEIIQQYS